MVILLIEGMRRYEVGVCSTIYRLNLAPAAVLAFVFLGEEATAGKILAVIAAVGAVLMFFEPLQAKALASSRRGLGLGA
jgi:drug/metabolite transporter (DMT)-like permease